MPNDLGSTDVFGDPATGMVFGDVGTSTPQPDRPGVLNDLLANTVGVVWRGASGTVDPWTKAQITDDSTYGVLGSNGQAVIDAAGGPQAFHDQADAVGTKVLMMDNADPSQFSQGLKNTLSSAGSNLKGLLVLGILILVVAEAGIHEVKTL